MSSNDTVLIHLHSRAHGEAATRVLKLGRGTIGGIFRMATHAGQQPLFYQELFVPPNGRQMRLADMVLPTGR